MLAIVLVTTRVVMLCLIRNHLGRCNVETDTQKRPNYKLDPKAKACLIIQNNVLYILCFLKVTLSTIIENRAVVKDK